jgi:hypothetical protein
MHVYTLRISFFTSADSPKKPLRPTLLTCVKNLLRVCVFSSFSVGVSAQCTVQSVLLHCKIAMMIDKLLEITLAVEQC